MRARRRLSGGPISWFSAWGSGRAGHGVEQQRFAARGRFFIGVFIFDHRLSGIRRPVLVQRKKGLGTVFHRDRRLAVADDCHRDDNPRCDKHYVRARRCGWIRMGFSDCLSIESRRALSLTSNFGGADMETPDMATRRPDVGSGSIIRAIQLIHH